MAALATITILVGNVGALGQSSLKRMLAYSSVAQAGYMLAGVVVATRLGVQATVFYLAVYVAMNMASFAVIVARERETDARRLGRRGDRTRPRAAVAGVADDDLAARARRDPATAGFIGKFYLIDAAVSGGYTWLGVVIVVGSMISLGYYLPVIAAMWMREAPAGAGQPGSSTPRERTDPGSRCACRRSPVDRPSSMPSWAPRRRSFVTVGAPIQPPTPETTGPQPEVVFVAVLAGAATLFFGIIPQPLFNLVTHAGGALGGLF